MLAIRVARTPVYPGGKGQGSGIMSGFGAEPLHVLWMLIMLSQGNTCGGCDSCFPPG